MKNKIMIIGRVLALVMVLVIVGAVILANERKTESILYTGTKNTADCAESNGEAYFDGEKAKDEKTREMPKSLAFTAKNAAETFAAGKTIDVRLAATVKPDTALNQQVDWSFGWGTGATRANEAVTNYIEVTPDSEGSRFITVSCKQAFEGDTVILTVTTREGGFSAQCIISYVGKASAVTIKSDTIALKSEANRMTYTEGNEYYELGTSGTYEFAIAAENELGPVGRSNLAIGVTGIMGENVYTATFRNSPGSAQWVENTLSEKQLSSFFGTYVTATIDGNVLRIETKGDPNKILGMLGENNRYDHPNTVLTDGAVVGVTGADNNLIYQSQIDHNKEVLNKAIFYIRIDDTVSGKSSGIYFWISSALVTGVTLTENYEI